ncbi:MAG: PilZ domain-containing protein [Nitrospirae bacterium]|nr:PilZ domain-containing protein [Nitrospirota bacterium]
MEKSSVKLGDLAFKVTDQKAHSLLDRRYAERVPIRYRVAYSGTEGARIVRGEGVLKNLSKTGCKILSTATISLGGRLTLLLYLEDGQAPMRLNDTLVSWVDKESFSVRFPKLSPEERKRLQDMIFKNISLSAVDHRRTGFRIV